MTAEIKLNAASGGGSVSLKAPSSTTSNAAIELQLPAADGTNGQVLKTNGSGVLSFGADTGGKILQIIQVAPNSGSGASFSTTNTSGQHVTALDTSITPIAANSKLFVMMNIRTQNDSSSDVNSRHSLNMARTIGGGSLSSTLLPGFNGIYGYSGSGRNNYLNHSMTLLDSPSYTLGQAIVYKFYLASDTSNNTARVYLDSTGSGPRSQITVMEVAA